MGDMLKSFVVRTYRFRKKKPRMLVGVVEEAGVKGRKAFTNIDELWEIFNSGEYSEKRFKKSERPERRNERRIKKKIPCCFVHHQRNIDASTVNYSKNGLGIRIFKKVAFPVGDILTLRAGESIAKAQVKWVKKEIDHATAGLKIVDGSLNQKRVAKNIGLTMRKESVTDL